MGTFQATGDPRFQSPPSPSLLQLGAGRALATEAGFRQFEWLGRVRLAARTSQGFEAGLIQNMLACSIEMLYSTGANDSAAKRPRIEITQLPILDSKREDSVWLGGNFNFLGTLTVDPREIVPPGMRQLTNTEAAVSGGDDPGGRFPVVHPQDSTRLLRNIKEQLEFITWFAVRDRSKPPRDAASYEFLKHVRWTVDRDLIVHHNPSGGVAAAYTKNSTQSKSAGNGQGGLAPVLSNPIANKSVRLVGISFPTP